MDGYPAGATFVVYGAGPTATEPTKRPCPWPDWAARWRR